MSAVSVVAGRRFGFRARARWMWAVVLVVIVAAGAILAFKASSAGRSNPENPVIEQAGAGGVVVLTPAKLAAAALHVSPVVRRTIQQTRRVPAKIGYNPAERLEIRVPVAGVVKQVLAAPGKPIHRGEQLAVLTSVEVGLARDEMVRAQSDVQLARKESDWADEIANNLSELLKLLETKPEVSYVEQHFKDRLLGEHRDKVLSAYSKWILAARISADTESLATKGAISQRYVQERESGREVSDAYFKSVCEQSRFDAEQKQRRQRAALEHAQRVLAVSQQKVKLLLGPFAEIATAGADASLCELIVRSPLDGLVDERFVAAGVQLTASQPLFAVANVRTLWVSAQLYEREWSLVSDQGVREVQVECAATPGERLPARVQFTGVSMSAETRAVPLVAEIANPGGRLKPGMFAWVWVPLDRPREVLAVPPGAIERADDDTFVFVAEAPGRFKRVDVRIGAETADTVAIESGLVEGQRVVDRGAFYLKSEVLLEQTED